MNSTSTNSTLLLAAGWVILGFLALLEAVVIGLIVTGKINLNRLISEPNGDASMSRLQLMIFTFVIAASLFLVIAGRPQPGFPDSIPAGVLTLLGISGSTYLVSKGIQFSSPDGTVDRPPRVVVEPKSFEGGQVPSAAVQFKAVPDRGSDPRIIWNIDSSPTYGTISPDGRYVAPKVPPVAGTKEVVKASSVGDCRAVGYAEILF